MVHQGSHQPPGRRLSIEEALERGLCEVDRLAARSEFMEFAENGLSATSCQLLVEDELVAEGQGKGDGVPGRVGALFEALERYWMKYPSGEHWRRPVAELASQDAVGPHDVVHRMAASHPEDAILVRRFANPEGSIEYPASMLNPFTGQAEAWSEWGRWSHAYLQYSSSVGTAAGLAVDEATLHGILELIEHDAVSLAMLGWFIAGDRPVRVVSREQLPIQVGALLHEIEAATSRELLLIDVTTDIGIPCFLAVLDHVLAGAGTIGAGAALSAEVAAERALREIAQMWGFDGAVAEHSAPSPALAEWQGLARCQRLAISDLRSRAIEVPWADVEPQQPMDVNEELDAVRTALARQGIHAYSSVLSDPASLIAVVSNVAPGLERFSIVRNGNPVVPTGRGRVIWESGLASQ